jgi:hypothetical protein
MQYTIFAGLLPVFESDDLNETMRELSPLVAGYHSTSIILFRGTEIIKYYSANCRDHNAGY